MGKRRQALIVEKKANVRRPNRREKMEKGRPYNFKSDFQLAEIFRIISYDHTVAGNAFGKKQLLHTGIVVYNHSNNSLVMLGGLSDRINKWLFYLVNASLSGSFFQTRSTKPPQLH